MPRSRSSSGVCNHNTGFPEQFVGTTHRHPEARVLSIPWEPKEVDMVRRARQVSLMRHRERQARQFALDEEEDDEDDYHSHSPITPRKRTTFPASRNPSNYLSPMAGVSAMPGGGGHGPGSAAGSSSPTGSCYTGEEMGRPITTNEKNPELSMEHQIGAAIAQSLSHSPTSTEGFAYHNWPPSPQAPLPSVERSAGGWGSWSSKFGGGKKSNEGGDKQRSRTNSFRS
ncbi:hypothetical protein MKZ38_004001 [Zalerion maritima]|uniref:Uncharacterized protein n=1 Tax=Zalerion maritima TaxID=339359 RepID=A0AAD5WRC0_9PEZI|nr:hypothetical protein MKZ38_004001 [Zalerion maritima]